MKRLAWMAAISLAAACGSDDNGEVEVDASTDVADAQVPEADADPGDDRDITDVTTAYAPDEDGNLQEVGPANWDCLGEPIEVHETENDITVSGRVTEFLNNDLEDVQVAVFDSTDFYADPIADPVNAVDPGDDEGGVVYEDLVVPAGVTEVIFRITTSDSLITFSRGASFDEDADQAEEDERDLGAFSDLTAGFLAGPALGGPRTDELGIVAGDVVDCDGNTVKHTIAALSTTSGELTPHDDSEGPFYFPGQLPDSDHTETNDNGRFMIAEIAPTEDFLFVQVWGYPDQESFDAEELVLLSEQATTIVADGLLTTAFPPLAGEPDDDDDDDDE